MRLIQKSRKPAPYIEPAINSSAATWFETEKPRHAPLGFPREYLADPRQVALVPSHWEPLLADPAIREAIEKDSIRIPHVEDREGYNDDCHLNYWLSGADDLRKIREKVSRDAFAHVLNFGGATGRFTRHAYIADDVLKITLADLNPGHVHWINEHFGPKCVQSK
jgi:hypothetical protein